MSWLVMDSEPDELGLDAVAWTKWPKAGTVSMFISILDTHVPKKKVSSNVKYTRAGSSRIRSSCG